MEQEFYITRLDWVGTRLNQFGMFGEHENCLFRWKRSCSEWKQCWKKTIIYRESKSDELKIKLYSCHDINMKFLVVVTSPSIYQILSDSLVDESVWIFELSIKIRWYELRIVLYLFADLMLPLGYLSLEHLSLSLYEHWDLSLACKLVWCW